MYTQQQLDALLTKIEKCKAFLNQMTGEEKQLLQRKEELQKELESEGITIDTLPLVQQQLEKDVAQIEQSVSRVLQETQSSL
jgi:cell division septum initiation protein DivIVA